MILAIKNTEIGLLMNMELLERIFILQDIEYKKIKFNQI